MGQSPYVLLFFDHLGFESDFVHLVDDLHLADLLRIEKHLPPFSPETDACLLYPFKPFQGFLNDQRSCWSCHALDFENDLICLSECRGIDEEHCQ